MKSIYKAIIIFLTITGVSSILINFSDFQFKSIDYFDKHGWFFLFFLTFFPRLSLFIAGVFGNIAFGGLFWWLGFFFAPRFLVATLATVSYWNTNQILVIISWLVAIGGESSEKVMITRTVSGPRRYAQYSDGETFETQYSTNDSQSYRSTTNFGKIKNNDSDIIEAEFKVKE